MKSNQHVLGLLAVLLLCSIPAFAQGTTGTLTGTVTHAGAGLPGVTVTITSPNLMGSRVAVTDINGNYNFPSIPPGEYTVQFDMSGMTTQQQQVTVGLARTQRVNAEMMLSEFASEITVTAAAVTVAETTEVATSFEQEMVSDLPIGRTIQNVVTLAPSTSTNGPGNAITISGANAFDSLFLIDGAATNENIRGQTDNLFIEDAIEETSILTGSISAEFGRFTGGVVSAITKSGGNEFSGSFRDSFTNPSWDETTPLDEPQQESNLNQTYEATLGGPIVRDRLWFFGAGRYFEQDLPGFFTASTIPRPTTIQTDERWEAKLSGRLGEAHSLVGTYLDYTVDQTPHCAFGCWDLSTMDINGRQLPRELITAQYSGVMSDNFLVEAGYSFRDLRFSNSGGDFITTDFTDPRDIALGTWAYDLSFGGAWGAPIFCGICDDEIRESETIQLKGTYYLSTANLGSHSIVAGYENFAESRFANNHQSGSAFDIYVYNGIRPTRTSTGELRPVIAEGDLIQWVPIQILSQGSDFQTDSIFINDKWDFNQNFSFNIGARYDKNDGADSSGRKISDDSNLSPRLGATWDVNGDGRFRVNASYSKYVSKIQEGIGGTAGGGNPSYFQFEYRGPTIGGPDSGLDSFGVLEEVFRWFLSQCSDPNDPSTCGVGNTDLLVGAGIPGVNQIFDGSLQSPSVDEFTVGFGTTLGRTGFVRADYINRDWADFYATFTTPGETIVAAGNELDLTRFGNTNDLERTYDAIVLQAGFRPMPRLNIGGNYTWSETKGNTEGENRGSGPITDNINTYVEYRGFAAHNPTGFLLSDQTHKARIWLGYDLPLGGLGNLNISVLERYDSGTAYSAVANVPVANFVTNPGYATPPGSVTYFFSDRGEFRWDDLTATDLALNWGLPIGGFEIFLEGEVLNLFDESAQIAGSTSVSRLTNFNPFTDTPVEGVDWRKNASFGTATSPNHYQLPRTYRFSAGFRF
ncbi:MAG: TonB-dependent receptor [Acidobacteria bacterium]|nr:TonB-dependent receptor [Acidobacteriota bacterium]